MTTYRSIILAEQLPVTFMLNNNTTIRLSSCLPGTLYLRPLQPESLYPFNLESEASGGLFQQPAKIVDVTSSYVSGNLTSLAIRRFDEEVKYSVGE